MTGLEPFLLIPAKMAFAKLAAGGAARAIHEIADSPAALEVARELGLGGARDLAHDLGDIIQFLGDTLGGQ